MTKMIVCVLAGVLALGGIGCSEIEESESVELDDCDDAETDPCEPEASEAGAQLEDLIKSTSPEDNWRDPR